MREAPPGNVSPLDEFGAFVVKNLHDAALECGATLLAGRSRAPSHQHVQSILNTLTPNQREAVRELLNEVAANAMHDFLFALQEQADFENHISLTVRGQNVVAASDGIHGEAYGPEGWLARFSAFQSPRAV